MDFQARQLQTCQQGKQGQQDQNRIRMFCCLLQNISHGFPIHIGTSPILTGQRLGHWLESVNPISIRNLITPVALSSFRPCAAAKDDAARGKAGDCAPGGV